MDLQEKLVSVIIPVYNVEKYVRRCIDSVLAQTYTNLEIILVDDGSNDASGDICEQYKEKDSRVIVIHQENKGLSGARNTGLEIASGDYIGFVDSDDWIENDTYQYCMSLVHEYNDEPDVVQFGIINAYDDVMKKKELKECIRVYKGKDILQNYMYMMTKTDAYCAVWRCLFSKRVVSLERFREGKINEDIDCKYRFLSHANCLIDSNLVKYYYYQSKGSLTTAGLKRRDFDLYDAAKELVLLTKDEEYGTIRELACVKAARTPFSLLCKIAYYGVADEKIRKEEVVQKLQTELRANTGILLKSPILLSRKILVIMFYMSYRFTEKVIRTITQVRK